MARVEGFAARGGGFVLRGEGFMVGEVDSCCMVGLRGRICGKGWRIRGTVCLLIGPLLLPPLRRRRSGRRPPPSPPRPRGAVGVSRGWGWEIFWGLPCG
eukprot:5858467-Pyramimonas_sp.AAC.1